MKSGCKFQQNSKGTDLLQLETSCTTRRSGSFLRTSYSITFPVFSERSGAMPNSRKPNWSAIPYFNGAVVVSAI